MLRRIRFGSLAVALTAAIAMLGTTVRGQDASSAFGDADGEPASGRSDVASSGLAIEGSLAVDDPNSVDWSAAWNKTGSEYASFFSEWKDKGYRPFDFDAAGPSDTRYSAVWIRNDGRGWAGLRDMDSETFGTIWQQYANTGYRLVDQKAYLRNGQMNYAGIWIENREGVAWASYRNMTETQWAERFAEFRDRGYRPLDVEVYTDLSGVKRFAAIFVLNDEGIDWVSLRDMSAATYAEKFQTYGTEGYQVYKLHSYRIAGVQKYAAIWYRASGRAWAATRDLTSDGLGTKVSYYKGKGYRPIGITRYDYGDDYRYAAVFRQNSNSTITPAMFAEIQDFDGELGIYALNLSTGKSVKFRSTSSFYLASVTKVAVMAELYRRFDEGSLRPTTNRRFTELYYREDKKSLKHADIGTLYTYDDYASFMIDTSDTSSTDILVNRLGAGSINATIQGLNLGSFGKVTSIASLDKNIWKRIDSRFGTEPNHIFEDWLRNRDSKGNDIGFYDLSFDPEYAITEAEAYRQYYATGLNSASPEAITGLVRRMARKTLWSKSASEDMLDKLRLNANPKFGSKLPTTVRCGSKGGDKYQVATEVGFIEDTSQKPLIVWAILGNKVVEPSTEVRSAYGDLGLLIYEAIK